MKTTPQATALGLLALFAVFGRCAEPPVYRAVSLTLQERLPRAEAVVVGDQLRLVVKDLEPLKAGTLWAWTKSGQSWKSAGAMNPGELSSFTVPNAALLEEVLVTHETAAAPSRPELLAIIFRGRPGEALSLSGYGGPTRASLLLAVVTAEISQEQVQVKTTAMPFLGTGLHYGVWVRNAGSPPVLVGRLGTAGKDTFEAQELLAAYEELVVAIELDNGVEAFGTELWKGPILGSGSLPANPHGGHEH